MPDYGRAIKFGYFLIPNAEAELLSIAQEVERRGLDYIAVQDHPYQRRFVDTWALLSMIAASTSRLGLFTDVANLPLRPPAVMAKTAATIDLLSGDRNLRFEGKHYHLRGAHSGPVPAHPIGIWLGVTGPRALRLAGRTADGWVPSFRGDLQKISSMAARLDNAAAEAGRDPASIRRILNVNGTITDGASNGILHGPVTQWVDDLTNLALTHGFDTFILWAEDEGQLLKFAEEVVPAVRAQVAAGRA